MVGALAGDAPGSGEAALGAAPAVKRKPTPRPPERDIAPNVTPAGAAATGEEGPPNTLTAAGVPTADVAAAAAAKCEGAAPQGEGAGTVLPNAGVAALAKAGAEALPNPEGAEELPNPGGKLGLPPNVEGAVAGPPNEEGEGELANGLLLPKLLGTAAGH